MHTRVLLNAPNIVCYIRILLVFTGCLFFNQTVFITFICLSAMLDMVGESFFILLFSAYILFCGENLMQLAIPIIYTLLWSEYNYRHEKSLGD